MPDNIPIVGFVANVIGETVVTGSDLELACIADCEWDDYLKQWCMYFAPQSLIDPLAA